MMLFIVEIFCPMLFMLAGRPDPLLDIQVSNIKYDRGSIMVAIYDDPDQFLKDGAVYTIRYPVSVAGSGNPLLLNRVRLLGGSRLVGISIVIPAGS